MMSNVGGVYLGHERFAAIFDALNRRKAVIFVHPTDPADYGKLRMAPVAEWPFDTDAMVASRGYQNRSEAFRDRARAGLHRAEPPQPDARCVAALVYVYDHARRDLPNRLANEFHDHHDLAASTLRVHLDTGSCLEIAVLRGAARDLQHMADNVIAERGVRYGQLVLLPETVTMGHRG